MLCLGPPILLLAQHGNPLLAFLLRSNIAHDAIDSDGVAPLVEAFDYDCSLACFHGENMRFDPLTFAFLTSRKTHAELTRMVIRVTDADGRQSRLYDCCSSNFNRRIQFSRKRSFTGPQRCRAGTPRTSPKVRG
jgi:hypothetical protein